MKGFVVGMLLGVPWALGNVVLGGAGSDRWVGQLWQPLVTLQPGIVH
jgi:hypothetical protein